MEGLLVYTLYIYILHVSIASLGTLYLSIYIYIHTLHGRLSSLGTLYILHGSLYKVPKLAIFPYIYTTRKAF